MVQSVIPVPLVTQALLARSASMDFILQVQIHSLVFLVARFLIAFIALAFFNAHNVCLDTLAYFAINVSLQGIMRLILIP